MFTLIHGLSGFMVTFVLAELGVVEPSPAVLASAFFFSILPDLDFFSIRTVKDHHESLFHAPLFWLVPGSALAFFHPVTGLRIVLHTWLHLLNDYLTARTTGLIPLHPFSDSEYSLFSMEPGKGDFDVLDWEGFRNYFFFYIQNRYIVFYEVLTAALGVSILVSII